MVTKFRKTSSHPLINFGRTPLHQANINQIRGLAKENPLLGEAIGELMTRKSLKEFENGINQWKQTFSEDAANAKIAKEKTQNTHALMMMDNVARALNEIRKKKGLDHF